MKTKFQHTLLLLVLTVSLLTPIGTVQAASSKSKTESVSPESLLNADGTLKLNGDFSGALDLSGYDVKMDPKLGPVFSSDSSANASPANSVASGDWAALGDGGGNVDASVWAIVVSGSNAYVGGNFTDVANIPEADYVAKWDGANWSALGSNGSGDGSVGLYVAALALSGTDLYVGGSFGDVYNSSGSPVSGSGYIAKWDTLTGNWSALGSNGVGGSSLNSGVTEIAVNGSNVYVGGYFTNVNNNGTVLGAADYVAKWNASTANWSALGSNGSGDGSLASGTYIGALAVNGTDVFVGGSFTDVNNGGVVLNAADYIAKWDGSNWSALGSNGSGNGSIVSGTVYSLAVSGTDVYVGGQFADINNNGSVLSAADYVAKWDALTGNWSALGSNGAGNGSLNSYPMALFVNGSNVYATGDFTNVNNNGTLLNEADYVAKWDALTGNWSALGNNGAGDGAIPNKAGPSGLAIAMQGSNVLVGGFFYDVNNGGTVLSQADFLAQWDGTNWSSLGSDSNGALVNGYGGSQVYAIAIMGTDVYVGGLFTDVSNHGVNLPAADYIAKWDTLTGNWSALGSNGSGNGSLSYSVTELAVIGTDLYVGGVFTNVKNGAITLNAADYIAKWDTQTQTWSALGSNGAGNGSLSSGSYVNALAVHGTDLYVGGGFTNVNNNGVAIPEADYIAKWDTLTGNWSALGNNGASNGALNAGVNAIAFNSLGELYAGGGFTNGANLPEADYIAKWNGASWSALGNNGAGDGSLPASSWVYALATSGTNLYVGGVFTDLNNNGTVLNTADFIAKWDGANWSALGHGYPGNGSINSRVDSILVSGSDVYVGGMFYDINSNGVIVAAADKIARWDGTNWYALGNNGAGNGALRGFNDSVETIVANGADLLIGGQFSNVSNHGTILKEADYIAAYGMDNAPDLTPPTVQSITLANPNPTKATSVDFTVTFSEDVFFPFVAGVFVLTTDGVTGASVSTWNHVGNVYTFTVDTGSGNGTIRLDVIDNDSIVDAVGNPLGGAGTGNGDFTSGETYTVTKTAPLLYSPTNGATLMYNRPTFDWSDYPGATGYQIAVATNSSFSSLVLNKASVTSTYTASADLPAGKTLYWRARAKVGASYSGWSASQTIITAKPPSIPVLKLPANGALLTNFTPTLDWANSTLLAGTTFDHYQVQVSTSTTFLSTLVDDVTASGNISASFDPLATPLTANTKYYWHVRAFNNVGQYSSWSTIWSLRAIMDAPLLVSPNNGFDALTLRPAFSWSAPAGPGAISGYTIQISKNNIFSQIVHTGNPVATNYTPTVDLPKNVPLYWRVQAKGANGPSAWSAVRSFNSANSPSTPVLSLPALNALLTDDTPLLKWNAVTLPADTFFQYYQLQLDDDADFSSPLIDDTSITNVLTVQFQMVTPLTHNDKYYWRVRAVNTDNEVSNWSAIWYFRIKVDPPTLLAPANGAPAGTLQPVFDWTDATGPDSVTYTIQVSSSPTFSTVITNANTVNSTYQPSTAYPAGKTLYWRVRVNGANGPSAWSVVFSFTTP